MTQAVGRIDAYLKKYKLRLSVTSSYYITQVWQLITNLKKAMQAKIDSFVPSSNRSGDSDFVEISLANLLSDIKCLDYDLGKLRAFIEETDLTHKIMYFSFNQQDNEQASGKENPRPSSSTAESLRKDKSAEKVSRTVQKPAEGHATDKKQARPSLNTFTNVEKIFGFCVSLIKGYRFDSTVILTVNHAHKRESSLSYYPLDISPLFNEIIDKAHSVLFTGGTMKPKGLLEEVLKHSLKEVVSKDFPAVISDENIACSVVGGLPPACDFLFNQANSGKLEANFKGVCELLVKVEKDVPGGIVVFFTSYSNLAAFKNVALASLRLAVDRDLVFDSDKAWDQYRDSILKQKRRAILFSVMGGKLSEGINFKDQLGNPNLQQHDV